MTAFFLSSAKRRLLDLRKRTISYAPQLTILGLALIPLVDWYRGKALVWGGDGFFPLNLSELSRYFTVPSLGISSPNVLKLPFDMPLGLLLFVFRTVGLPWNASIAQKLTVILLMFVSGIGSYSLILNLFPKLSKASSLIGAAFYMYNRITLILVWSPQSALIFHYSLLPCFSLIVIKLSHRPRLITGIYLGLAWTLLMSISYTTLPLIPTDVTVLVALVIFSSKRSLPSLRKLYPFLSGLAVTWVILNLYWIVPLAAYIKIQLKQGVLGVGGNSVGAFQLNSAGLSNLLRLGGYWGLHGNAYGQAYFVWGSYYHGFVLVLAYLPICLAILALIELWKSRKYQAFNYGYTRSTVTFVILLVLFGVLATGSKFPFGHLKEAIFIRTGLIAEYRSTFERFAEYLPLFISPLLACGVESTVRFAARVPLKDARLKRLLTLITFELIAGITIVLIAFPMISGEVFNEGGLSSDRINIPKGIRVIGSQLPSSPSGGQTLVLPMGSSTVVHLVWPNGEYLGIQPLLLLTNANIIEPSVPTRFTSELLRAFTESPDLLCQTLQQANIHYVVQEFQEDTLMDAPASTWIESSALHGSQIGSACLHKLEINHSAALWVNEEWHGTYGTISPLGSNSKNNVRYVKIKVRSASEVEIPPTRLLGSGSGRLTLPIAFDPNWRLNGQVPTNNNGYLSWTITNHQLLTGAILINPLQTRYEYLLGLSVILSCGIVLTLVPRVVAHRRKAH